MIIEEKLFWGMERVYEDDNEEQKVTCVGRESTMGWFLIIIEFRFSYVDDL